MAQGKTIAILFAVLLMVCGSCSFAQAQEPPGPPGGRPADMGRMMEYQIDMMFHTMDTNHDGKISKAEWMAFYAKRFNQIDKNRNGYITKSEVRADMREAMRAAEQQRMQREPQ